jgi:hypothetical protein
LKEGLEETLTVKRLGLQGALERSLATTNPIENLHSVTRTIAGRVKRCPNGDTALRWVSAPVIEAERGFKRLKGYRAMSTPRDRPPRSRQREVDDNATQGRLDHDQSRHPESQLATGQSPSWVKIQLTH